ncbi:hypothetical protein [Stenomitos frigidus]|uniref:Plastid lipid-associated protein/fibrillin conserved domain-containing protein n=1 Tax=Stenomitos frigidus ULC18 TaxID=2107698 RepID=A0A2T1E952_9CYAN|nr:hypothetical protein [Stenomitos frigidus]PSB29282.1 hypothetical protein C7B82_11870 [Stenomitos frigidus ULC18]
MTAELIPTHPSPFITVLSQAATAFQGKGSDRPTAASVVEALLQAEKTTKRAHQSYPFESLLGNWQLCFATGTRKVRRGGIVLGNGFYVPKLAVAQISFQAESDAVALGHGAIGNQVEMGPVRLRFTGPAHYLGKKTLLAFDFTYVQLSVLGKTAYNGPVPGRRVQAEDFYSQSIVDLPFFAFFLVTPNFIAARGRGGGLALWVKTQQTTDH